jgi:hypothetical protein
MTRAGKVSWHLSNMHVSFLNCNSNNLQDIITIIIIILIYPLGELETSLPSWLTKISRSSRQPDV